MNIHEMVLEGAAFGIRAFAALGAFCVCVVAVSGVVSIVSTLSGWGEKK